MKFLFLLVVILLCVFPIFAEDSAVILSLAAPCIIYAESDWQEQVDISSQEFSKYGLISLALPCSISESDIRLSSAFSINPLRGARFAWKAYDIFHQMETLDFISKSGFVYFSPSVDHEAGRISVAIQYDDITIKGKRGNDFVEYSLNGNLEITVLIYTDSLIDFSITTGDITISGNTSLSNNSLNVRFWFNEDYVYDYLESFDLETARRIVIGILMRTSLFEELSFNSDSDYNDMILFAMDNNAIDFIDSLVFALIAFSDNNLSELDIFSMITTPVLYENGIESEDIDLSKVVDVVLSISDILK